MIKKIICCLITVTLFMFSIVGCSDNKEKDATDKSNKISVITTIFPAYDFARAISGDNAEINMLIPPGAESHSYEPSPRDILKIQNCDLFIYVGGESEEWVNEILDSMDTSEMKIISLMECVPLLNEEITEGMEDHSENDEEGHTVEYDEHVWTSPKNAIKITEKIGSALCSLNPENEALYKKNTEYYNAQLTMLDTELTSLISSAKRKTVVFGDRFPFAYLAKDYGLTYYAAFPGCSAETEPAASTVAFLINKVKEENIPVVFYIEFSNEKMADTICEATGAKKMLLHSCHNVQKEDFEKGITYIELMKQNISALREALN